MKFNFFPDIMNHTIILIIYDLALDKPSTNHAKKYILNGNRKLVVQRKQF